MQCKQQITNTGLLLTTGPPGSVPKSVSALLQAGQHFFAQFFEGGDNVRSCLPVGTPALLAPFDESDLVDPDLTWKRLVLLERLAGQLGALHKIGGAHGSLSVCGVGAFLTKSDVAEEGWFTRRIQRMIMPSTTAGVLDECGEQALRAAGGRAWQQAWVKPLDELNRTCTEHLQLLPFCTFEEVWNTTVRSALDRQEGLKVTSNAYVDPTLRALEEATDAQDDPYDSQKSDVYALGVLAALAIAGAVPAPDERVALEMWGPEHPAFLQLAQVCPAAADCLLHIMLFAGRENAEQRCSIEDVQLLLRKGISDLEATQCASDSKPGEFRKLDDAGKGKVEDETAMLLADMQAQARSKPCTLPVADIRRRFLKFALREAGMA